MKMKKLIYALVVVSLIFALLIPAAFAENENQSVPYVFDQAGLLSSEQAAELEEKAAELTDKYSCGVYIYILTDYSHYSSSIEQCAQDLYEYLELGTDNKTGNRDLVLFVISMSDRDYTIYTNGYKGNEVFNNTGINSLEDTVIPYLKNNNWYGGFTAFLAQTETLFENPLEDNLNAHSQYTTNTYGYETDSSRGVNPVSVLISVFVPCLLAFIVCNSFKIQMKNAENKTTAGNYIESGGINITNSRDVLVNRTVTRQVIQTSYGGGRGGGGGFSGGSGGHFSGGASGHSGKF